MHDLEVFFLSPSFLRQRHERWHHQLRHQVNSPTPRLPFFNHPLPVKRSRTLTRMRGGKGPENALPRSTLRRCSPARLLHTRHRRCSNDLPRTFHQCGAISAEKTTWSVDSNLGGPLVRWHTKVSCSEIKTSGHVGSRYFLFLSFRKT